MLSAIGLCCLFLYGTILLSKILRQTKQCVELGEGLAIAAGVNILLIATVSMILAILGFFFLWSVIPLYGLILAIVHIYVFCFQKSILCRETGTKTEWKHVFDVPLLLIILSSLFLYFLFPSNYLWSGRDYGLYIVNAVHTADTGKSFYETDKFLNANYEEIKEFTELGYPALFSSMEDGISENPGDINAQFLPLYWCLLALGYKMGGFRVLIRVSAIISLLTLAVFYYFVKHFFSKKAAVLSAFLLEICPAQIWGARITQSEQLMQLIVILFIFLFALGWQKKCPFLINLSIAVAGIGCFCRMDHYIAGLALLCIGIYTAFFCISYKKMVFWAIVQYVFWFLVSLGYGFLYHYHYYMEHWEKNVLKYLVIGNVLLFFVYVICILINYRYRCKKHRIMDICLDGKKMAFVIGALAFILLLLYIKPYVLENGEKTYSALAQYCWYICPLTVCFALYGIYRKCTVNSQTEFQHTEEIFLFLCLGLGSTLLYSMSPAITMDHFWMSRRFLPVNFPFLICFGMYGISCLLQENRKQIEKVAAGVCIVCILLYTGYKDKDIWNVRSYSGMTKDYEQLLEAVPAGAFVLTTNEGVASALKYIYHRNVYMLKEDYDVKELRDYLSEHKDVYFIGELRGYHVPWGIEAEKVYQGNISTMASENSYGYFPKQQVEYSRNVDVVKLSSGEVGKIELMPYLILCGTGNYESDKLHLEGQGMEFYGPYFALQSGEYILDVNLQSEADMQKELGKLEIVVNEQVIEQISVQQEAGEQRLFFSIDEDESLIQIRFTKEAEEQIICNSIILNQL